jgi:phosphohistidine swiveling domain-containing protein
MEKINGILASRGKCEGKIIFFHDGDDTENVNDNSIIIADNLSKEHNKIILKSKAIISTHGGITSHVAIVCRELNKPCIVNCGNAREIFKEGEGIILDATNLSFQANN